MEEPFVLHKRPEAAAEMAANAVVKYLNDCEFTDPKIKRYWLDIVFNRVKDKASLNLK
jgi:hypothetical protein